MPFNPTRVGRNTGYSDFFASGLRAMTAYPASPSSINFPSMSPTPSPRPPAAATRLRDRRAVSMFVTPTKRQSRRQQNRSSIIEFSSRMIGRVAASPTEEATSFGKMHETRSRLAKNPLRRLSKIHIITDQVDTDPVDPFASSPNSKSYFIDLTKRPAVMNRRSKRESSLSLSGTSRDHPRTSSAASLFTLTFPFVRKKPSSIHTMPLPETRFSPTRSSFYRRLSASRSQLSFSPPRVYTGSGEESPLSSHSTSSILEEDEPESDDALEWNDPADIDWRQFHIEFL